MTLGQILGRSFKLYGDNFLRFIAIVAVVYIPWALLNIPLSFLLFQQAEKTSGARGLLVLLKFVGALVSFLASAAIFKSVSGHYLGVQVTCKQAYKSIWPKIRTLVAASALWMLCLVLPFVCMILPLLPAWILRSVAPEHNISSGWICFFTCYIVLALVTSVVLMVLIVLWFAVTAQCIVAENLPAWGSMKRSKTLVKGNMGRVLVLTIVLIAMGLITQWPFNRVGRLIGSTVAQLSSAGSTAVRTLLSTAGSILIVPISAVAMALLYYDLRERKKRVELEQAGKSVGKSSGE